MSLASFRTLREETKGVRFINLLSKYCMNLNSLDFSPARQSPGVYRGDSFWHWDLNFSRLVVGDRRAGLPGNLQHGRFRLNVWEVALTATRQVGDWKIRKLGPFPWVENHGLGENVEETAQWKSQPSRDRGIDVMTSLQPGRVSDGW